MTLSIKSSPASVNSLRHLSKAQFALSKSLERLSSGERINRGADDPAGLIISENLRSQIAGLEQAIENSEFSVSMVQTAEGALTEVNNLLIEARQLSVAAANEGANDLNSLLAIQSQLDNALKSIDRVSSYTQFGNKKLLDGSHGISGVSNNENLHFISATANTRSSPVQGYSVKVTQAPTRAMFAGELNDDMIKDLNLSVSEGKNAITVRATANEKASTLASRLQEEVKQAGLNLDVSYDAETKQLRIEHNDYGSNASFKINTSKGGVLGIGAAGEMEVNNGKDIQGSIGGENAVGHGNILSGTLGNRNTDGLAVQVTNPVVGEVGSVSVVQNALVFQIGGNAGQRVSVTLENTNTSALAKNVENESGFKNLSELNVTTAQGAQDAIHMLDKAINQISATRGKLGSFQKNTLESNIATLQVTAENLIAAESSIRDTDVAYELAEFTKNKILTETSSASLAQAGDLHRNSILKLIRE
ncbi:MAG: flagellin [SAR324 cluster bacterium]|nr:flagellin [SAR324 cluster bacterium]